MKKDQTLKQKVQSCIDDAAETKERKNDFFFSSQYVIKDIPLDQLNNLSKETGEKIIFMDGHYSMSINQNGYFIMIKSVKEIKK